MTRYIALLRAVNVGGTGKLPMKDLADLCTGLGFRNVRTYIQSGNVVFDSATAGKSVRTRLEKALTARMGKRAEVIVRTGEELRAVLNENPFPHAEPAKVGILFLSDGTARELMPGVDAPGGEEVRPGTREIYIHFPDGMGRSKLKIPGANGTMRNINTLGKLAAMISAR